MLTEFIMTRANADPLNRKIDPKWIAAVAREVVIRLQAGSAATGAESPPVAISDRVVTADAIAKIKTAPAEVTVLDRAVITPAARDEASRRRIKFRRSSTPLIATCRETAGTAEPAVRIIDAGQPERAGAVASQIASRGISTLAATIVLSESPAADVHHQCVVNHQRAAMINSLADVDRFVAELDPTVWVLDMARINFMTAVNVVARIAKCQG